MSWLHRFSIRARLTLIFVFAIALILSFTGLALVHLVRNSLANDANNEIQSEMVRTQERFVAATSAQNYQVVLPMHGNVVVQVIGNRPRVAPRRSPRPRSWLTRPSTPRRVTAWA